MTILLTMLLFLAAMLTILLWPAKRCTKSVTLYYAVDADGTACMYFAPPVRETKNNVWSPTDERGFIEADSLVLELPPMTWEDEPREITITF